MALSGTLEVHHIVSGCSETERLNRLLYCVPCARLIAAHPIDVRDDTSSAWCPRTLEVVDQLDAASLGGRSRSAFACPDCSVQLVPRDSLESTFSLRCPHCSWDSGVAIGLVRGSSAALVAAASTLARRLGDAPYTRKMPLPTALREKVSEREPDQPNGTVLEAIAAAHFRAARHMAATTLLAAADPSIGTEMPRVGAAGRPLSEARADFMVRSVRSGKGGTGPHSGASQPSIAADLSPTASRGMGKSGSDGTGEKSAGSDLPPAIANLERRLGNKQIRMIALQQGQGRLGDRGMASDDSVFDPVLGNAGRWRPGPGPGAGAGSMGGLRGSRGRGRRTQREAATAERDACRGVTLPHADPSEVTRKIGDLDDGYSHGRGRGSGSSSGSAADTHGLHTWATPSAAGQRLEGGAWLAGDIGESPIGRYACEHQLAPRPLPLMRFRHLRCRGCVAAGRPGIVLLPKRVPADCLTARAVAHKDNPPPAEGTKPFYDTWSSKADFASRYLPALGIIGFLPTGPMPELGLAPPASRALADIARAARTGDLAKGFSATVRSRFRRRACAVHPTAAHGIQEAVRRACSGGAVRAAGREFLASAGRSLEARDNCSDGWEPEVPRHLQDQVVDECFLGWMVVRAVNRLHAEVRLRLGSVSCMSPARATDRITTDLNEGEQAGKSDGLGSGLGGRASQSTAAPANASSSDRSDEGWWPHEPSEPLPFAEAAAEVLAEQAAFATRRPALGSSSRGTGKSVVLEPVGMEDGFFQAMLGLPDVAALDDEEDDSDDEIEAEGGFEGMGLDGGEGPGGLLPIVVRRIHDKTFMAIPIRIPPAIAIGVAAVEIADAERRHINEGGERESTRSSDEQTEGRELTLFSMRDCPVLCSMQAAVELPGSSPQVIDAWQAAQRAIEGDESAEAPSMACIDMGQVVIGCGTLQ